MRKIPRTYLPVALAALLCAGQAAFAQDRPGTGPRIAELRIQVLEAGSRRDLGYVNPGGTITVPERATLRLIMTAVPAGGGKVLYPETEFTDPSRRGLRITRTNEENANATVEIPDTSPDRERVETIQFRITEDVNLPDNQRTGSFNVRITPVQAGSTTQPDTSGVGQPSASQARNLVSTLYRSILLREMDEAGAQSYIADIQRNGYRGLLNAAQQIARSEESRIRVYERENVCNQQRLLALYKHLLGQSSGEIDPRQWDAYLRELNGGDVADVVTSILQSERFRTYHRLDSAFASGR